MNGWNRANDYVSNGRAVRILRRILKSNRKRLHSGTKYRFGVAIPRNTKQAYLFDEQNGNTLWADAIKEEMDKILAFETFEFLPAGTKPDNHQRIPLHMCFAVKWDGRHKARLVAGGHHTLPGDTDAYANVVSNESVRIGMFLATLNNLDVLVGDVGNAYLHANTNEKVYSVAGPEFGEHQGKTIRIVKSLYGLRTSHIRWRNFLNNDLRAMNFTPSKVDADLWYRDAGDHYEYIAVYVDDIMVFSRRAAAIMEEIQEKYKMKGVGKPEIYLGGNIGYHDPPESST